MATYYDRHLSGERLRRCYQLAPPRVQQYLEAEIRHVTSRLGPADLVLELGCGYGRVALRLAEVVRWVVGIDTAGASLALARRLAPPDGRCSFVRANALALGFPAGSFDFVVCVQNGICAFGVDGAALMREAVRVTRPGGRLLFSSYSDRFWSHRLAWFEAQGAAGLLGPIDHAASGDGVIVCLDGFRAGRMSADDWSAVCARIGVRPALTEVDESSVFCELVAPSHDMGAAPPDAR